MLFPKMAFMGAADVQKAGIQPDIVIARCKIVKLER